jgi:hypothetical protein
MGKMGGNVKDHVHVHLARALARIHMRTQGNKRTEWARPIGRIL